MTEKATAAVPLETYRIGEYALVLDILGSAERMATAGDWLTPLKELLDIVVDAVFATTDVAHPDESAAVFQHGDTIVLPGYDAGDLVALGQVLLARCAERGVLVQAGLGGGGAYYIHNPSGFGTRRPLHPEARLQVLVGRAVARGHLLLRKVVGPRFLIDAERVNLAADPRRWERFTGKAKHEAVDDEALSFHEVWWWRSFTGDEMERRVDAELTEVNRDLADAQQEVANQKKQGLADPLLLRDIRSMKSRLKHLQAFREMLDD